MTDTRAITFNIEEPDQDPREVTLRATPIKVGKLDSAHLCIHGGKVSRMHAYIETYTYGTDTDVFVSDLGSQYGTQVNGQRVNKAKLHTGDVVTFGDVTATVMIEGQGEVKDKSRDPNQRPQTLMDLKAKLDGIPDMNRPTERRGTKNIQDLKAKLGLKSRPEYSMAPKEEPVEGMGPPEVTQDDCDVDSPSPWLAWLARAKDGVASHAGAVRETWRERAKEKVYYCDPCFHLYGRIKEMVPDEDGEPICPYCQSHWRLNRGQARHEVALKLKHYRALAVKLGMND